MEVLILGGARFIGPHITDALLHRGHAVTQFNRGTTKAPSRDAVTVVHGDRSTDLDRLPKRDWDAVIETCGFTPATVALAARTLQNARCYIFISSVSVYDPSTGELAVMPPGADDTKVTNETYGALKVLCERAVQNMFGSCAAIVRPGLIAGPLDPTDRFTYWPLRVDAGGRFIAPEDPSVPIQYIDARDLAEFVVKLFEDGASGTFDAVTAPGAVTFGDLIDACTAASDSAAEPVWVSAESLQSHKVEPWSDLPLWIPRHDESAKLLTTSNTAATSVGLSTRSVMQTVIDTLDWAKAADKRFGTLGAGLSPERENELISATA